MHSIIKTLNNNKKPEHRLENANKQKVRNWNGQFSEEPSQMLHICVAHAQLNAVKCRWNWMLIVACERSQWWNIGGFGLVGGMAGSYSGSKRAATSSLLSSTSCRIVCWLVTVADATRRPRSILLPVEVLAGSPREVWLGSSANCLFSVSWDDIAAAISSFLAVDVFWYGWRELTVLWPVTLIMSIGLKFLSASSVAPVARTLWFV